jgi:Flp pilus assembly pilin Flp
MGESGRREGVKGAFGVATRRSAMSKMLKLLAKVSQDEEGASLAEYILLLGVIVGAIIVTIGAFGNAMNTTLKSMCNNIMGAGSC